MSANAAASNAPVQPVRLKAVALPVEHGGWGMLGEPLLLGVLIAPSWAGVGIGLAAVFAFLTRHPLKLVLADRLQGRSTPRSAAAGRFATVYAVAAAASLTLAATGDAGWWIPLAAAVPMALVQLSYDARNQSRHVLPQTLGGVALGSIVAAMLRAAGWGMDVALAAWGLVAARTLASILYVRARLLCDRGLPCERTVVLAVHGLAVAVALALAASARGPWLAVAAFVLLAARAAHGLSRFHRPARPQAVGFAELAFGIAFTFAVAIGYAAGW